MLKAIQTRYKGYHFRSRLEARWAVFFDALGIKWEYEKEGYDLGADGWYLPDFWLPELKWWVEIKGQEPTDDEKRKASALAEDKYPVVIFWGNVDDARWAYWTEAGDTGGSAEEEVWFVHCVMCDRVGIQIPMADKYALCTADFEDFIEFHCLCSTDKHWKNISELLMSAAAAARSARFEHGETPKAY